MLIKSQHIVIYYNKILKITLEFQILLQHFSDMFQLIKKVITKKTELKINCPPSRASGQVVQNHLSTVVQISHQEETNGCKDF
jgi:hypothetical protein